MEITKRDRRILQQPHAKGLGQSAEPGTGNRRPTKPGAETRDTATGTRQTATDFMLMYTGQAQPDRPAICRVHAELGL